jgi:hypothetical protein
VIGLKLFLLSLGLWEVCIGKLRQWVLARFVLTTFCWLRVLDFADPANSSWHHVKTHVTIIAPFVRVPCQHLNGVILLIKLFFCWTTLVYNSHSPHLVTTGRTCSGSFMTDLHNQVVWTRGFKVHFSLCWVTLIHPFNKSHYLRTSPIRMSCRSNTWLVYCTLSWQETWIHFIKILYYNCSKLTVKKS